MGQTDTEASMDNAQNTGLVLLKTRAPAEAGALHFCMTQKVGPVQLRFGSHRGFTAATVPGDRVLPGISPLEDHDLVVQFVSRTIGLNPIKSNFPVPPVASIISNSRGQMP